MLKKVKIIMITSFASYALLGPMFLTNKSVFAKPLITEQPVTIIAASGKLCTPSSAKYNLLNFPTWYKYLNCETVNGKKTPIIDQNNPFGVVILIGLAILEILLRLSSLIALGYVIFGGIKYTVSQGSAEGISNAKSTITNALIGLVITMLSSTIVVTIANVLSKTSSP